MATAQQIALMDAVLAAKEAKAGGPTVAQVDAADAAVGTARNALKTKAKASPGAQCVAEFDALVAAIRDFTSKAAERNRLDAALDAAVDAMLAEAAAAAP